jgi:hypothetical protein
LRARWGGLDHLSRSETLFLATSVNFGVFFGKCITRIWEQGFSGARYMQTRFHGPKVTFVDDPIPSTKTCPLIQIAAEYSEWRV